jgi:hypothetical protein
MGVAMKAFMDGIVNVLADSRLTILLASSSWIVPLMQTIHILGISMVMSASFLMSLRTLGLFAPNQPIASIAARFLPWIWWAIPVLFLTGSLLILAEPKRELLNPTFRIKMALVLIAAIATAIFHQRLTRAARTQGRVCARNVGNKAIAAISLVVWIAVLVAGRMIAYDNNAF